MEGCTESLHSTAVHRTALYWLVKPAQAKQCSDRVPQQSVCACVGGMGLLLGEAVCMHACTLVRRAVFAVLNSRPPALSGTSSTSTCTHARGHAAVQPSSSIHPSIL